MPLRVWVLALASLMAFASHGDEVAGPVDSRQADSLEANSLEADSVEADSLEEIVVAAPEPRYVAPTLRDRIGRVWAPVYVNGQGPLRLVLDTGASNSALTRQAAERLGLSLVDARTVLLRGVTGAAEAPVIDVDRIEIGDLTVEPARLLIIDDAFGGAEGV